MQLTKSNLIERFETRLTPGFFFILLSLLIIANWLVWFGLKPVATNENNQRIISTLESERDNIKSIIAKACTAIDLRSENSITTPLRPEEVIRNQAPSFKGNLVELLQAATVMVIHKNGSGSGFFIDSNTIVTNRHVVEGIQGDSVQVVSNLLRGTVNAKIISTTRDSNIGGADFALLKINQSVAGIKSLSISGRPTPLQRVIAVGYPGSAIETDNSRIPSPIFTSGDVSAIQPQTTGAELVVHTADISPGSSGGPLTDRCGSIVGINTFVRSNESRSESRRLFALSAETLRKFLEANGQSFSSADTCSAIQAN